jgi:hypothetical protein
MQVTAGDDRAGPLLGVFSVVEMGIAYCVAWLSALAGTAFGVIGLLEPAHRTKAAWIAFAANAFIALVLSIVILIMSP